MLRSTLRRLDMLDKFGMEIAKRIDVPKILWRFAFKDNATVLSQAKALR